MSKQTRRLYHMTQAKLQVNSIMRNIKVELRLGTVLQTSENKCTSWPPKQVYLMTTKTSVPYDHQNKCTLWPPKQVYLMTTKTSVPHDHQNKCTSWPPKVERWESRNNKETATNINVEEHAGRSRTIENEEIQNWREHLNQILNFGLGIQEYLHTESPYWKGNPIIRRHSPTQWR
jgi:hypothetical protein